MLYSAAGKQTSLSLETPSLPHFRNIFVVVSVAFHVL